MENKNPISPDYIKMCKLMIESYHELVDKLSDRKNELLLNGDVWLFFGPTRTGKSTLLSRIKSDDSIEEFLKFIEETKNSNKVVNYKGIGVSPLNSACTTVPNFYDKSNKLLLDLAGFVDPNSSRESIISLLNKCLFPKLKTCKLLIIISLGSLTDLVNSIRPYISELKKLLTKGNFNDGVSSCGFVFTKCDVNKEIVINLGRRKPDEDISLDMAIERILNKFIRDMVRDNGDASTIGSYMSTNYCVVDYSIQNSDDVWKILESMMNGVPALNSSNMFFDIEKMTNNLSQEGGMLLNHFSDLINKKDKFIKRLTKQTQDYQKDTINQIKEFQNQINITNQKINQCSIDKAVNEKSIIENEAKVDIDSKLILKLQQEFKQLTEQLEHFKGEAKGFKILSPAIIRSVISTGMTKKFKVYSNYQKPAGSIGKPRIIVMLTEKIGESLKQIERCNNIESFNKLNLPKVYDDGTQYSNSVLVEMFPGESNTQQIRTSSNFDHCVIYLTEVSVINAGIFEPIVDFFAIKIRDNEIEQSTKEIEIRSMLDNIKTLKSTNQTLSDDDNKFIETLKTLNNLLHDTKVKHSNFMETSRKDLLNQLVDLESFINDESFKYTKELSTILLNSNIAVSSFQNVLNLDPLIVRIKLDGSSLADKISSYLSEITRIS